MSELQSGQILGRYELLVRIGRGGMASVWVARERSASSEKARLVAVKAMLPELREHSEFRSMFLGEVQIIQAINHDHVVRVYEVSEDHGILYMAMEWVEGDSLRNIIRAAKSRGALPPEIAVRIVADAAQGLHAAHELRDWSGELRGIVHCDVSPHNILVGLDGKAKLVDFGIANALGQLDKSSDHERIKGKLSYMSPEQAGGDRLDRRTDVFALGIVLFELTTGEQLFKGRDPAHTLSLVRYGTIPRPTQLFPRFPLALEEIVLRALDRDPDRRFQTAAEFEQALSRYLYEERILVSHTAVAQLLHRVIGARIEKRKVVLAQVIAALDDETRSRPELPWQDIAPLTSDPFNNTLVNSTEETGLGVAARLESHTIAALSDATPPRKSHSSPLVWVSIAIAALGLGAAGAAFTVMRARTPASTVEYIVTNPDPPSSARPPTAHLASASFGTEPREPTLSADSLPLATSEPTARGGALVGRPTPGRAPKPSKDDDEEGEDAVPTPPQASAAEPAPTTASEPLLDETKPAREGIDRSAANAALASAAAAARGCRSHGDRPTGSGRAAVTFAPDGSVAAVSISQQFSGTTIGNCVIAHFRQARAPAFSGEPTTLFYPFQIPE